MKDAGQVNPIPYTAPQPITRRFLLILTAIIAGAVILSAVLVIAYLARGRAKETDLARLTTEWETLRDDAAKAEVEAVPVISAALKRGDKATADAKLGELASLARQMRVARNAYNAAKGDNAASDDATEDRLFRESVMQQARIGAGMQAN